LLGPQSLNTWSADVPGNPGESLAVLSRFILGWNARINLIQLDRCMRYMHAKRRAFGRSNPRFSEQTETNDPLSGVANLFDVGLVFIVGLLFTLFSAYHLQDLFSKDSELTLMKQSKSGQMEIITKKGTKIDARKVTKKQAQGRGKRLGTAYRLEDGSMVYVPDG
jgi:hypothetical protein